MSRAILLCAFFCAFFLSLSGDIRAAGMQAGAPAAPAARDLFVTVGKSLVVESPVNIQRVSVGDGKKAEAIAVNPREVLVNGKEIGETSLIIWQAGGNRLLFDLRVQASTMRLDAVRQEMAKEVGPDVSVTQEGDNVFIRGMVNNLISAQRAEAIAASLGKPVNLLRVKVQPVEDQILLKVKFVSVDRSVEQRLGINLFSLGAANTIGSTGVLTSKMPTITVDNTGARASISDQLNVFLFRPDLKLGTVIEALQTMSAAEMLAEPNLLTANGKPASFLAGGEFPVPVIQSAGMGTALTVMWREYGIRLNFVPTVTPRGTIRLRVAPEVSTIDQGSHGATISGYVIPALITRRAQTEVELQDGQTFAVAGLISNEVSDVLTKIPGIGDIPILGKLFQSRQRHKNNNELLVVITPELVRPIPAGQPVPDLKMPLPFLKDAPTVAPRTPPVSVTGPVPVTGAQESVPFEELRDAQAPAAAPQSQVPLIVMPGAQLPVPVQPGTMTGPPPAPKN